MSKNPTTENLTTENSSKIELKSELKSLGFIIFIALLIRTFVIEPFFVPTTSMKATILEHEYIFSTKYNYGFSKYSIPFNPNIFSGRIFSSMPERGDVIIMRPPHDMTTRYIKRLIGLPGDKIEIKRNVTYINDKPVERVKVGVYIDEDNQEYNKYKEKLPSGLTFYTYKLGALDNLLEKEHINFGPYVVPEGHFFFLGDNRDQSGDSRYQLGFVPFENLIAKAWFVFLSTREIFWDEKLGVIDQVSRLWPWLSSIRFNRLFASLYGSDGDDSAQDVSSQNSSVAK